MHPTLKITTHNSCADVAKIQPLVIITLLYLQSIEHLGLSEIFLQPL
jgi:hypothetical protein